MDKEMNKRGKEDIVYEKLSKRALHCMYAADIVTGLIILAVIGAVNYFWLFPKQIEAGKRSSPAASHLLLLGVLVRTAFPASQDT